MSSGGCRALGVEVSFCFFPPSALHPNPARAARCCVSLQALFFFCKGLWFFFSLILLGRAARRDGARVLAGPAAGRGRRHGVPRLGPRRPAAAQRGRQRGVPARGGCGETFCSFLLKRGLYFLCPMFSTCAPAVCLSLSLCWCVPGATEARHRAGVFSVGRRAPERPVRRADPPRRAARRHRGARACTRNSDGCNSHPYFVIVYTLKCAFLGFRCVALSRCVFFLMARRARCRHTACAGVLRWHSSARRSGSPSSGCASLRTRPPRRRATRRPRPRTPCAPTRRRSPRRALGSENKTEALQKHAKFNFQFTLRFKSTGRSAKIYLSAHHGAHYAQKAPCICRAQCEKK